MTLFVVFTVYTTRKCCNTEFDGYFIEFIGVYYIKGNQCHNAEDQNVYIYMLLWVIPVYKANESYLCSKIDIFFCKSFYKLS